MKVTREASSPVQEKMGLMGKVASDESDFDPDEPETFPAPSILEELILGKPRNKLMKVPVKIGQARMMAVYDTGSQLNLISQQLVESAGLPWCRDRRSQTNLVGIDGSVTKCVGKIPMTRIRIGASELPTYGEMHVLPTLGTELLLGRTWQTMNKTKAGEQASGSIIEFQSKGKTYEVNACPTYTIDSHTNELRPHQLRRAFVAAIERSDDEESEVADNEIENDGTEYARICAEASAQELEDREDLEHIPDLDDEDAYPTPAQRPQNIEEFDEKGLETKDDEDRCWLESPAKPIKQEDAAEPELQDDLDETQESDYDLFEPHEKINISSNLHERCIRLEQKGPSTENWDAFCKNEARLQARDNERWKQLNRPNSEDEEGSDEEDNLSNKDTRRNTRANTSPPSHTLATNPTPLPSTLRTKLERKNDQSKLVATRRSRRIERRTKGEDDKGNEELTRSYLRHERLSRKTLSRKVRPVTRSATRVFCARIAPCDVDDDTVEVVVDPNDKDEDVTEAISNEDDTYEDAVSNNESDNNVRLTTNELRPPECPDDNDDDDDAIEDAISDSEPDDNAGLTTNELQPPECPNDDDNDHDDDDDNDHDNDDDAARKDPWKGDEPLPSIPNKEPPSGDDDEQTCEWKTILGVLVGSDNKISELTKLNRYPDIHLPVVVPSKGTAREDGVTVQDCRRRPRRRNEVSDQMPGPGYDRNTGPATKLTILGNDCGPAPDPQERIEVKVEEPGPEVSVWSVDSESEIDLPTSEHQERCLDAAAQYPSPEPDCRANDATALTQGTCEKAEVSQQRKLPRRLKRTMNSPRSRPRNDDDEFEMVEVTKKLEKIARLVLQIDKLVKTIRAPQKAQADVNSVILSEISNVKLTNLRNFNARIKRQSDDIVTPIGHYDLLNNYVASPYYAKQAGTNHPRTFYTVPQSLNINDRTDRRVLEYVRDLHLRPPISADFDFSRSILKPRSEFRIDIGTGPKSKPISDLPFQEIRV